MDKIKAEYSYTFTFGNKEITIDKKRHKLLNEIHKQGSISKAAKTAQIPYRSALNYIDKMEEKAGTGIVNTKKGGKGGGGSAKLSATGKEILKECNKLNVLIDINKKINEIPATIIKKDTANHKLTVKFADQTLEIDTRKNNEEYHEGDEILMLINYKNIILMETQENNSIQNIFPGKIIGIEKLENGKIRVKLQIQNINLKVEVTQTAKEDLKLSLDKEIYIGFKSTSPPIIKA